MAGRIAPVSFPGSCLWVGPTGLGANSEGSAVRDANGQVCKDCDQAVGRRVAEGEVVRDLVNCEEQVLVRCRTDNVRREEERPREDRCVPKEVGCRNLYRNNKEDHVFRKRLRAAELGDLQNKTAELVSSVL